MSEKIFISYAQQDSDVLKGLEKELRKHGIVEAEEIEFIDPSTDYRAGENMREAIKDQIQSASKVVLISSVSSSHSQWVNYEVGMASALNKPIYVVSTNREEISPLLQSLGDVPIIKIDK